MLLLVLVPLAFAALAFAVPSGRVRPRVLLGGAVAPRRRRGRPLGRSGPARRWAAGSRSTPPGSWCSRPSAPSSWSAPCTSRATWPRTRSATTGSSWASLLVLLSAMTVVVADPAPGAAVGGHRGHHPGHRAAHLLQPRRALAGGHLEVPDDLLGRDRAGPPGHVLPGPAPRPGRAGRGRCSSPSWWRPARSLSRPWVRVAFVLPAGRATARRWAWPRSTPGSRTPTARRRGCSARSWPAASPTSPSWRSCASTSVCQAAGEGAFARGGLLGIGLVSMVVAAVFMVGQRDFKRLLAYSSVEHMGILALGVGLGGAAASGAFFHMVNNGLTKGVLFLTAGNIHRAFGSKQRRRGARGRPPAAHLRAALPARVPGHHRFAALRAVLSASSPS